MNALSPTGHNKRLLLRLYSHVQVSFEASLGGYTNEVLSKEDVIIIMVGDLQLIKLYPLKGFQIHQEIPLDVWSAYEELVKAGYDQRLVDEPT